MDRIQEEYLRMPVVKQIADAQEMGWVNPGLLPWKETVRGLEVTGSDIDDAEEGWNVLHPLS